MATINDIRPKPSRASAWTQFMDRLNGPLHEKALWIYVFIVTAHWMEHLLQAYQIFVAGWARPDAKGLLGFWWPALVTSEVLHFMYGLFVITGLILLRPAIRGVARTWWDAALLFETWHVIEHTVLQWQAITHDYFFGATMPISFLQLWIPRVELHLIYNIVVTVPTLIGLYFHRHPPKRDRGIKTTCTCVDAEAG